MPEKTIPALPAGLRVRAYHFDGLTRLRGDETTYVDVTLRGYLTPKQVEALIGLYTRQSEVELREVRRGD